MRFLKVLLPILVLGILAFAPHPAYAANATFFGPIIPPECHCDGQNGQPASAPDFKCVLATTQNAVNLAISVGVMIFVLVCAYAGFLYMFSSINAENKNKAKGILTNAVVGLLLALAAWLLVDFIMKTLYNEKWGPWYSILGDSGEMCLKTTTPPAGATGTQPTTDGVAAATFSSGQLVECTLVPARPNDRFPGTVTASRVVDDGNPDTPSADMVTVAFEGNTSDTNQPLGTFEVQASICRLRAGSPTTPTTPSTPTRLTVGTRVECYLTDPQRKYPGVITAVKNSGLTLTIDFDAQETGDVPASQCTALSTTQTPNPNPTCSVPALTPLTDALAQRMESGTTVIWEGTDSRLQTCANKFISAAGGGSVNSAFRPASYQTHLWELHDRWCTQELRSNTASSCSALKSSISAEITKHGLSSCGAVGRTSRHTAGTGVDIRLNSGNYSGTATLARESCLVWANYDGDPWHYNLVDGCSCQ